MSFAPPPTCLPCGRPMQLEAVIPASGDAPAIECFECRWCSICRPERWRAAPAPQE